MSHWQSDWLPTTQPMAPYILRLTHSERGDGIGVPDRMWLVGPFTSTFARANYISRHNPEAKPGWLPVNAPVSGMSSIGLCVLSPEDGR